MKWWTKFKGEVVNLLKKTELPVQNVPESQPLSPCIIKPYYEQEGVKVDNKAYIPVALLMRALDDKRILNIAIAGNYGVGKSSIINTAEYNIGKKHNFIKISLASLLTQEGKLMQNAVDNEIGKDHSASTGENQDIVDNKPKAINPFVNKTGIPISDKQIEYSILQQILYHDRPQISPKSRIRRLHKTKWYKSLLIALLMLLVIISLVMILKPAWYEQSDYFTLDDPAMWYNDFVKWGPIIILAGAFIIMCVYCSQHFTLSLFKIGYKNVEMKIADEISVFNAYMDEIVYFFETTKYDVVVFEDLDRFVNKDIIFYKLRELNTILNNSRCLKRKINFVYAVLDHLFDATERVKFFDYIITVIPVINSLNSYNMLKERIQPKELFDKLGGNELLNLCDYLQDMRILLNIVNEFNQFSPLLDRSLMKDKILFGIVVYKNYVPSDFAAMYNKSGIVARVLDNADFYRDAIIKEKKEENEKLNKEIDGLRNERDGKLVGLRRDYLEKGKALSSYPSYNLKIKIDNISYLFETVAEDAGLFNKIREGKASYIINSSTSSPIPSFNTVDINMGGEGYFEKIEKKIKNECDVKVDALKRQISFNSIMLSRSIRDIGEIYGLKKDALRDELDKLGDKGKQELVKFLVLNGYLDREYQYYISYFYPNSLKLADRNFVMKAGRYEGTQYDVKLEAIDEVLKRFTPKKMGENISLLNVDLTRTVFQDSTYYRYREPICHLIEKYGCLDFLTVAYNTEPKIKDSFYLQLLKEYDFWDSIDDRTKVEQKILREIYIKFCDLRPEKLNPSFISWFDNNYSFLEKRWDVIGGKRVLALFDTCKPVFCRLIVKNTPEHILKEIIDNNRYEYTRQNINAIVQRLGFIDNYKTSAFTSLMKYNNQSLIKTVMSNLSVSLKSVFPETSVYEDDGAQIEIINALSHTDSRNEVRLYLLKQQRHVENVEKIKDEVLDFSFESLLVASTWQNVYYYTVKKGKGLPIQFMYKNNFHEKVGDSLLPNEEKALRKHIVFSDVLKFSKYKELIHLFNTPFETVDKRIQNARMRYLVENRMLAFNEDNYRIIRDDYNLSSVFLVNNLNVFLEAPGKYVIDSGDAVAAINSLNTKKAKCAFMRAIKEKVFEPTPLFISLVSPLILSGDLKVNEVNVRVLTAVLIHVSNEKRLFLGKKILLSLELGKKEMFEVLKAIGGEYKRLTSDTTVSTISNNRDSVMILNRLVKKGYIKGYEKKNDKLIVKK